MSPVASTHFGNQNVMSKSRFTPTLLCLATLAATASAQTIQWGNPQIALAATDVSLNGTLVVARNLHASGAAQSPTVNGVPFVGSLAPTGWTNASTLALQGSTTGDAGYDLLLNSARATSAAVTANPTGWGAIRLDTLAALTVGRNYEIQCWFTDQRPGGGTAAIYDRVMTLSSAVGAATLVGGEVSNLGTLSQGPISGPLDGDPDNAPALSTPDILFGSYCIGTFARVNATDQLWLLVQGSHPIAANTLRSHLTAFQIRDIGQAGSYTTFGAGCPTPVGIATNTASPLPSIGVTSVVTLGNVPNPAVAILLIGSSNTFSTSFGPLPLDLTPFGAPGCSGRVSDDVAQFFGIGGGTIGFPISVPNDPFFIGLSLYTQGVQFENVNSLGIVLSDAATMVIGG